jgi:hypothetical protein
MRLQASEDKYWRLTAELQTRAGFAPPPTDDSDPQQIAVRLGDARRPQDVHVVYLPLLLAICRGTPAGIAIAISSLQAAICTDTDGHSATVDILLLALHRRLCHDEFPRLATASMAKWQPKAKPQECREMLKDFGGSLDRQMVEWQVKAPTYAAIMAMSSLRDYKVPYLSTKQAQEIPKPGDDDRMSNSDEEDWLPDSASEEDEDVDTDNCFETELEANTADDDSDYVEDLTGLDLLASTAGADSGRPSDSRELEAGEEAVCDPGVTAGKASHTSKQAQSQRWLRKYQHLPAMQLLRKQRGAVLAGSLLRFHYDKNFSFVPSALSFLHLTGGLNLMEKQTQFYAGGCVAPGTSYRHATYLNEDSMEGAKALHEERRQFLLKKASLPGE